MKQRCVPGQVAAQAQGAFRSSWTKSPMSATTRASPGWARPPSPTKAACTSMPSTAWSRSYEHIDPEAVGNHPPRAGQRHVRPQNILMKAAGTGLQARAPMRPETRSDHSPKSNSSKHEGYEYEAAEGFAGLAHPQNPEAHGTALHGRRLPRLHAPRHAPLPSARPRVKVRVDGETEHTVAEGDGPVNALDGAARRPGEVLSRSSRTCSLTDYKVRILDSVAGTGARPAC